MKDCDSDNDRSPFCRPGRPPSVARVRQAAPVSSDHAYAANRSRRLRYLGPPASGSPHINPAIEKTLTQRLNQCNKENQKLKNLLLVNLDLVQQQSDRILSKEKVLADLKKENATLHLRVQRNNLQEEQVPAALANVRPPLQDPPPLIRVPSLQPISSLDSDPLPHMQVSHPLLSLTANQPPLGRDNVQAAGNYPEFIIAESSSGSSIIQDIKEEVAEVHLADVTNLEQQNKSPNRLIFDEGVHEYLNTCDIDTLLKECEDSDLTKTSQIVFTENQEVFLGDFETCDTTDDSDAVLQQNTTNMLSTSGMTDADQKEITNTKGNCNPIGDDNAMRAKSVQPSSPLVTSAHSTCSGQSATRSQHVASSGASTKSPSSSRPRPQRTNIQSRHRRPVAKLTQDVGPPTRKSETVTSYTQFYKSRKAYRLPRSATVTTAKETDMASPIDMIDDARSIMYTGSLSDRFKLIDTPPTGEDPYQLGEADIREQSPILKFHHAKAKDNNNSHANVHHSSYYSDDEQTKKMKSDPYETSDPYEHPYSSDDDQHTPVTPPHSVLTPPAQLKIPFHASISDFSYGESQNILSRNIFDEDGSLSPMAPCSPSDYLLQPTPEDKLPADVIHAVATSPSYCQPPSLKTVATVVVKPRSSGSASNRRPSHTSSRANRSLVHREEGDRWTRYLREDSPSAPTTEPTSDPRNSNRSNRSSNQRRKEKDTASPATAMSSVRSYSPICSPHFHTTLGSANSSWRISPTQLDATAHDRQHIKQLVEVPRWREVPMTTGKSPLVSWSQSELIEEHLSDVEFEMRHRKLELVEKRQKRWDQQRTREQIVLERLGRRQSDARASPPFQHSFLPEPVHKMRYIELLRNNQPLPVSAFGDNIPRIPQCDFYLPWIRSSKPKRKCSKKCKYKLSLEKERDWNTDVNSE